MHGTKSWIFCETITSYVHVSAGMVSDFSRTTGLTDEESIKHCDDLEDILINSFHYGGQAVIEGVMMRGQKTMAMAVRRPNGELSLTSKPLSSLYTGWIRKTPFLRGIVVLIETMILGFQALSESANISLEEEEEDISGPMLWGVLLFSILFAVGLFFIVPLLLTELVESHVGGWFAFVEGLIRVGIFLLYLAMVNLLPDLRKVFAYHGAEHKTINAYEDGAPLEIAAIRPYSTSHTRCGTAFLLFVMVIAIGVFALVGHPAMWLLVLSRIVLVPFIAGISYEATQYAARHDENILVRGIIAPGLLLQKMTTRQPNDAQLEAAIAALADVLKTDSEETQEPSPA